MWKWFKKQTPSTKGMIILCIVLVIGIIVRWGHVSAGVADAFKGLFEKPQQEQTAPAPNTPEE